MRKPFHQTKKSVLIQIKKLANTGKGPKKILREMYNKAPRKLSDQHRSAPRNVEQIRNTLKNEERRLRFSQDALYNIVELMYEKSMETYISAFQIGPDVRIFGYDSRLVEKLENLLGRDDLIPQCLSYDTTFKLGDFYCSFLAYTETEFEERPIILGMFLIHERKTFDTHNWFWEKAVELLPKLKEGNRMYIVTDGEQAIVKAIIKNLPVVDLYRCWNHVMQDVKRILPDHGIKSKEQKKSYKSDIYRLFRQKSKDDYTNLLLSMAENWENVKSYCKLFI